MGTTSAQIGRIEAVALLEADRAEILALCTRLSSEDMVRPGLGGGGWSPVDLLGHLESWEEHALRALDAWSRGEPAPIDRALRTEGLTAVNRTEVERRAGRTGATALRSAATTHASLLTRLAAITDEAWAAAATPKGRRPLGHRLGQILAGTRDPFRHDEAHLGDLSGFVDARAPSAGDLRRG